MAGEVNGKTKTRLTALLVGECVASTLDCVSIPGLEPVDERHSGGTNNRYVNIDRESFVQQNKLVLGVEWCPCMSIMPGHLCAAPSGNGVIQAPSFFSVVFGHEKHDLLR